MKTFENVGIQFAVGHNGLVVCRIAAHFQGQGFKSHLYPVCMEFVWFGALLQLLQFPPLVQKHVL